MRIFIFVLAAMLMSCAQKPVKSKPSAKNAPAVSKSSAQRRDTGASAEFAREKQMVMQKKPTAGQASRSARPAPVSVNPQNKRLVLDLKAQKTPAVSEAKLMAELQEQFDLNNQIGFQSRYQAFTQRYSKSARINEVHYMSGLLALSYKNYGGALRAFDLILKNPRSPQSSKAMFAKAMTYRRMNLNEAANKLLAQIPARYPKTLEAQRAQVELKIAEKRFQ